ncbi:MAG: hypothetical protein OEV61_05630 [Chloroflexota bacterium]|jgi:hypothetical protein|nr:hypothetical protein [Chloroflexota bacterium]
MMGKPSGSGATLIHPAANPPRRAGTLEEPTAMIHSSEPELRHPLAVRDGQGAPVTCAACGCRLERTGETWFHFNPAGGRDARGCRVACADAAHDAAGRTISLAV